VRIHTVRLQNLGPFAMLEEARLGPLATIVGQNDVGKSCILRALGIFMNEKPKMEEVYVHKGAEPNADVVIEVAFTELPATVELEEGVPTTFAEEKLTDEQGYLRIRKVYPRTSLAKPRTELLVHSFLEDTYRALPVLKEEKLNSLAQAAGIDVKKSGAGITNKGKRAALRAKAESDEMPVGEANLEVPATSNLSKCLQRILPGFELFECDTRLGVGETTFQSQFRAVVTEAARHDDVVEARGQFTDSIRKALQVEVDRIFRRLKRHTDAFQSLSAVPQFSWEKAVTLDILGRDQHDVETSFEQRGSGMKRLLMVAFFQYLAEREAGGAGNFVFAVEEPENCLHPRLQRELVASFRKLADEGYQIMVTSHSPVFAGASPLEDLALVVRSKGIARAEQHPDLDLASVADELGVEPADQISTYHACVFVEGVSDVGFWRCVARKLSEEGVIEADLEDKRVGLALAGGENLKHWIDLRAMGNLNRRFAVIVDSDRQSPAHSIPGRKLTWQKRVQEQQGEFFILRKREMENYIHPAVIARAGLADAPFDAYTDMKSTFGENVWKLIEDMSAQEILEADRYDDGGGEGHELKEILEKLLALPDVI